MSNVENSDYRHAHAQDLRRRRDALPGIALFLKEHPGGRPLLVGEDGIPLERFLSQQIS